ncbi:TatD family hydrolase [Otariodibacter sp.]|uniref:TatD family hydrolase n=1 Tax=Otariodibacter sp. TaxID=3030919 RepID=UPI002605D1F8|nr:TatD family hydrolase [Otariodibacter sp.]
MAFFDTHTHLDFVAQDLSLSISQLVQAAKQGNVERLLVVSVDAKNFDKVTACSQADPEHIVYGLGLHPLYIASHQYTDLDILERRLLERDPHCTAIAEIGLDKGVAEICTPDLWKKQCEFLEAQLSFAKRLDLPINLHSRKTHDVLFPFLKKAQLSQCGVIHGFSGSYEQAKRFVDLGYKIGIGGIITYSRANKTRETIRKLPLNSLVLETDSPDMPVFGYQGEPNRPERINVSFQALCELRTETPEQITDVIWQTSEKLFWLD